MTGTPDTLLVVGADLAQAAARNVYITAPGAAQTTLANLAGPVITITGQTRTLLRSDNGAVLVFTNGSAVTLTVPVGLGAGFQCAIVQAGAGAVTPTASSTTINNRQSQTATAGQYAMASLVAYAANTFVFAGDTA